MQALKFTLKGRTAFFKKPDVNAHLYFTYGHIHKVSLLGIFGAALGYKGYNQMEDNEKFPEFYDKLKDLKIGIVPNNKCGVIDKKVNIFNNSVGYASKEKGGNLIVKEQWLENPSWDIYVLLDSYESEKLSKAILNRDYKFIPYLGKNDHMADILNVSIEECEEIDEINNIDSFFIKEDYVLVEKEVDPLLDYDEHENDDEEPLFKYEEKLPIKLDEDTNLYILKTLIYTNNFLEEINRQNIYKVNNKTVQFL